MLLIRKPSWDRTAVTLIHFSGTAGTLRGFRSRSDGSVGFVESAVGHVGHLFIPKKVGAQRFFLDACTSNRYFWRPPTGPLLTGEGLCHVQFHGAPEGRSELVCRFRMTPLSKMRSIRCAYDDMVAGVFPR